MSKLRLLFSKEAQASYISHLDLMRTFQRVFPRTGLKISHSNGFHPHAILSVVLPLPVGQSSVCELLDLTVDQESGRRRHRGGSAPVSAGLRELELLAPRRCGNGPFFKRSCNSSVRRCAGGCTAEWRTVPRPSSFRKRPSAVSWRMWTSAR